uniref:Major capsid protein n=1 Tax=Siphoviridae sp. ct7Qv4 TaxID=2827786 RepID=A0A8S5SN20_9CAUD|nr:MAG TPA: major capsid protein [Siphoviridae sp. ct7Qv4]
MSRKIAQVFQDFYDSEVKRAYGDVSKLQDKVYTNGRIVGKRVAFRKKGKGMATQHIPGADVTAMNVDYNQVWCDLEDWEAYDYVDKFDMKKVNFSEITELAEVAADCLGLRIDQIIIDKMAAGYDTAKMKVGTTNTALTVAVLVDASSKLNANGVPSEERYFAHSAQQLADLLKTTEATSDDYNTVKALVNGSLDSYMGFKFVLIASRDEGGLPTSGNDVTGFCWHKRAMGFSKAQDLETSMDWIPEKKAYLVGGDFSAGAVVIDDRGIVGVISKKGA